MCSGVVKVTVLPEMPAISTICAMGRSMRLCQPREGAPGGEFGLHWVRLGLVTWSINTIWPTARPVTLATVTEFAPLAALAVRLVDPAKLGHRVPTMMTGLPVPSGAFRIV